MNADNMPIANQEKLNQEDYSKQINKSNSYSQNGNHGIGHMCGGNIKDRAKVAGKIEENNNSQSQEIINNQTIHNHLQNDSKIKVSLENEHEKIQIEAPDIETLKMCFDFLAKRYDSSVKVKDIEQGSIKFILKGSEEGLKNIAESFESGELAPLLKQQFNLELEDAELIDSDSSEDNRKNQSQKLLAFTIAGDVSQADIDILKATLINTSDNNETIETHEKSRLVEVSRTQGAVSRNLSNVNRRNATDGNYSYLDQNLYSSWENTFEKDFDKIAKQIDKKIRQLNLRQSCSIDQVKIAIFLRIREQINSGKLKYQVLDNSGVFLRIKYDGITEPIRNFKAYLATVSYNHLRQICYQQNKNNKMINLDNTYYIQDYKTSEQNIQKIELREKLKKLGDEDRRILEMRYLEGLTYKQICLILELEGFPKYTVENLRKKAARANAKLRKVF